MGVVAARRVGDPGVRPGTGPTWSSSSRHAGQRRMISAASRRSNGTPSALIAVGVHLDVDLGAVVRVSAGPTSRPPVRITIVVAGLALDLGPRSRRHAAVEPDVVGPVVAAADDPADVLRRAVRVAELELLEAQHAEPRAVARASTPPPTRARPSPTTATSTSGVTRRAPRRWRSPPPPPARRGSAGCRGCRSSIGAYQPNPNRREVIPSWTPSHTAQSWRLTRSQKSTASDGSKPGFASSSGWNRKSTTTSVRSGALGTSVNAATWSADRLIIRLG